MPTSGYTVKIDFSDGGCPRLQWFDEKEPLLADSATRAYTYDALTGGVMHYVSIHTLHCDDRQLISSRDRSSVRTTSRSTKMNLRPTIGNMTSATSLYMDWASREARWRRAAKCLLWKAGTR